MNENQKKVGLIAIVVVALAAIGYMAFKSSQPDKMDVVKTINAPAGYKGEKEKALEAQKDAGAPAPAQAENREKDLGDVGTSK
jgi:hypothetical protein